MMRLRRARAVSPRFNGGLWLALAASVLAAACAKPSTDGPAVEVLSPDLSPIAFSELPGWSADDQGAALPALSRSCPRLTASSAGPPRYPLQIRLQPSDWRDICAVVGAIDPADQRAAQAFLESKFTPFRVTAGGRETGLFTGYFEPEVLGSRAPAAGFRFPIYRLPPELVSVDLGAFRPALAGQRIAGEVRNGKLVPYAERAAIDAGALRGRGLELFWLADPMDAFVLQVQGSGRVRLPDGALARVGYAGQNGHTYSSIGRELVKRGAFTVEEASLQRIRAWVRNNPREADALFAVNRSYVFFKETGSGGPFGAQGVVLTPGRSLAVDRRYYPLGLPFWVDLPFDGPRSRRLQRLMVAQDTGGAIKGPIRGDYFWGHGLEAEAMAGIMKSRGSFYILLPRPAAARLAAAR